MNNLFLYIITVLVWGSTWIAIEAQLGSVAPEVSVFYRFLLASSLLLSWCLLRRHQLRFPLQAHLRFMLLGLLLFGLNYVVTYYAQIHISSALSAIVFSTMLWMNILNSRIFFGLKSDKRVLIGSMFGIAGILTLFLPEMQTLSVADKTLYGAALCVSGAFVASLGNMVSQASQAKGLPIVQSNAWGMFYGALFTGVVAWSSGQSRLHDGDVSGRRADNFISV